MVLSTFDKPTVFFSENGPRHLQRCAAAEEVLQGDKSSTNELSTHYAPSLSTLAFVPVQQSSLPSEIKWGPLVRPTFLSEENWPLIAGWPYKPIRSLY